MYAELRSELERHGTPIPEPDLRIAAIARTFNLVLVTGNEHHFRRVPALAVENWFEPGVVVYTTVARSSAQVVRHGRSHP